MKRMTSERAAQLTRLDEDEAKALSVALDALRRLAEIRGARQALLGTAKPMEVRDAG